MGLRGRQRWSGGPDPVQQARRNKELFDLAGISPDSGLAHAIRALQANGRHDVASLYERVLHEKAAQRILEGRIFRIPDELPSEGLDLGTATDLAEERGEVRLSLKSMQQHVACYGLTGAGKSFLVMHVVRQLIEMQEQ